MSNRGFTFTELLLVLTITFTLFATVLIIGRNYTEKQLTEQAIVQFTLDLYAVQSHAIGKGATSKLQFNSNGGGYVGIGDSRQILFRRTFPKGIMISSGSPLKEIIYTSSGSVDKFGAIQFISDSGKVFTLRLQFGKGRVILPEF